MKSAIILLLVAALANGSVIPILEIEDENAIPPSSSKDSKVPTDFLKITKAPPARVAQPVGSAIELECEVAGSPIPIVQWVHGSGQHLDELDDIEDNIISESDPTVMSMVRSRLVINKQIEGERTFTCVARSGSKAVYASTVVHKGPRPLVKDIVNELVVPNANMYPGLRPIRITNYIKSIMTVQGSNLVLPCKRIGLPLGSIKWFDTNNSPITGREPRFRILATGELLITNLKWADMGHFTCVAKNGFSEDKAETFIYPLSPE